MTGAHRSRASAQDGFTLVELLVAATLMMLVLAGSLSVLARAERGQRDVSSRTDALAQARTGTERLSREIRQASALISPATAPATPATLSAVSLQTRVYSPAMGVGQLKTVAYQCTANTTPVPGSSPARYLNTCYRSVDGGAQQPVVRNVVDPGVFSLRKPTDGTPYLGFAFRIQSRGSTVTLSDGVDMRNL